MHLQLNSRPGTVDVSADGLALSFTATPGLPVVGTLSASIRVGPTGAPLSVLVEVLAASHRVHVFDTDGLLATEQVACVGTGSVPLPAAAGHDVRAHRLDFTSERPDLDADALAALAAGMRGADDDDAALVVSFPGHPDALTSVHVLPDGWATWHLYPGERPHAVRTRTSVVPR